MTRKIKTIMVMLLVSTLCAVADSGAFTLVIDAGHGGHDTGAKGAISNEKDINLSIALAFGRYVERNCPDVKVVYTRRTDVFVPLHRRAEIANKNKANVFISIHTNALPGGKIARGLETYTMGMRRSDEKLSAAQRENSVITIEKDYQRHYEGFDPNSPESMIMFEFMHDKNMEESVELARYVQNSVCQIARRPDKGVKQDVFLVLRETSMPACLIELGFITTPDEERFLNNPDNIDLMARGIYNAFAKFKNRHHKGFTVPYVAPDRQEASLPSIVPGRDGNSDGGSEAESKPSRKRQRAGNAACSDSDSRRQQAEEPSVETKAGCSDAGSNGEKEQAVADGSPVFKVQVLAADRVLKPGSPLLKGMKDLDYYREGQYVKYTSGASADYYEIVKLRKQLAGTFPQAFVIAFVNGEKVALADAIKEFKKNNNK